MITLKEDAKKLNCDGLSYTVWMRRVNTWLIAQCGLSSDDLADGPSWDMWELRGYARRIRAGIARRKRFPGGRVTCLPSSKLSQ